MPHDPVAELVITWRREAAHLKSSNSTLAGSTLAAERERSANMLEAAIKLRPRGSAEQIAEIARLKSVIESVGTPVPASRI